MLQMKHAQFTELEDMIMESNAQTSPFAEIVIHMNHALFQMNTKFTMLNNLLTSLESQLWCKRFTKEGQSRVESLLLKKWKTIHLEFFKTQLEILMLLMKSALLDMEKKTEPHIG
jgi:hypothetical protein